MEHCRTGIPMPIVTLNRSTIVIGVLAAFLLRQPLITTALFLIIAAAAIFGSRGSLIYWTGSRLFSALNATAEKEDRRLMRFNNTLAAVMLGLAQIGFVARMPLAGWFFCFAVALAAASALAGFCIGCFLFFRFKMMRYRFFDA
jgi:hypothetical protein